MGSVGVEHMQMCLSRHQKQGLTILPSRQKRADSHYACIYVCLHTKCINIHNNTEKSQVPHYFHGMCFDQLHSLVPSALSFAIGTCYATYKRMNHLHAFHIPLVRSTFYSDSFFPKTAVLWNRLPAGCFPSRYNFDLFRSRVNFPTSPHELNFFTFLKLINL